MHEPKRAIVYLRVSTKLQNPRYQRRDCLALVRHRGWKLAGIVAEHDSANGDRPKFRELKDRAHRGDFHKLVIWSIDRFGRSIVKNFADFEWFEERGVDVISVSEPWTEQPPGPSKQLMRSITSHVAEAYLVKLKADTKAGLERARREGKHIGRPRRVISLERARRMANDGFTLREIAQRLRVPRSTLARKLSDKAKR